MTVSSPDFAIRRKGSKPKLLVVLPSIKQFYVKNEKDGKSEILDYSLLKWFCLEYQQKTLFLWRTMKPTEEQEPAVNKWFISKFCAPQQICLPELTCA